jgi:predicted DNA-binding transcriptional regulator YafY
MKPPKIQRWIDLLATLLSHHFPVTLEEIVRDVPAYQTGRQKKETLRRMFERDKDELRRFGVFIETQPHEEGDAEGYRLRARDFYLPYLALMAEGRPGKPRKVAKYGYRSLPTLVFEPDELDAVVHAATRVRDLGDPLLADHADSALRKLAVDLPVAGTLQDGTHVVPGRPAADAEVFTALGTALEDRKRTTFDYRSMGTDVTSRRTVEPFGLFFLNQHWYLAGRAPDEALVKNFRLSRIANVDVNGKKPGTPDYEIPPGFRLREHAQSKQAWELGDGDAIEAIVAFRGADGAAMAAARLGEAVFGHPDRRRFRVRRQDAFARWLLGFAGDAAPLAPPELVAEYEALVERTLARYAGADG